MIKFKISTALTAALITIAIASAASAQTIFPGSQTNIESVAIFSTSKF